jgi:putative ABC transport system permease protein
MIRSNRTPPLQRSLTVKHDVARRSASIGSTVSCFRELSVQQRIAELGVRMTLGAQRGALLSLVLGDGMKLVLIGMTVGLAASLALTRLVSSLLYEVSSIDPITFCTVALALPLIALLACYVPARRATRIDPIVALRCE